MSGRFPGKGMTTMIETIYWEQPDSIARVADVLEKGNSVLVAVYGELLLLAPLNQHGFDTLSGLKYFIEKPSILVSSIAHAEKYVIIPKTASIKKLIKQWWPGPLTLIFSVKDDAPAYLKDRGKTIKQLGQEWEPNYFTIKDDVPPYLKAADSTIALQMPRDEYVRALLDKVGPLLSTSAHMIDKPLPGNWDKIDPKIMEAVSFIVRSSSDDALSAIPATVLNCTGEKISVVYEGAYSLDDLQELLGSDQIVNKRGSFKLWHIIIMSVVAVLSFLAMIIVKPFSYLFGRKKRNGLK